MPRAPIADRIDAHAHVYNDAPAFYEMLKRLDIYVLNICVVDKHDRGYEEAEPQHAIAREIFRDSKGRIAWCSTFDPQDWESLNFCLKPNLTPALPNRR